MKLSPKAVIESAKDSRAGRYTAVNLTNEETVEIPIFRGTLKYNTFYRHVSSVNAICDVAVFIRSMKNCRSCLGMAFLTGFTSRS